MERLVEERSQIDVRTLIDLRDYYQRFITITTFLCSRNQLSNCDQSQASCKDYSVIYAIAFCSNYSSSFPDHLSDDPYHLDDIYEAAQFILHGTATSVYITAT
jgi:hypothetical protein